jgi:hypothetical protein
MPQKENINLINKTNNDNNVTIQKIFKEKEECNNDVEAETENENIHNLDRMKITKKLNKKENRFTYQNSYSNLNENKYLSQNSNQIQSCLNINHYKMKNKQILNTDDATYKYEIKSMEDLFIDADNFSENEFFENIGERKDQDFRKNLIMKISKKFENKEKNSIIDNINSNDNENECNEKLFVNEYIQYDDLVLDSFENLNLDDFKRGNISNNIINKLNLSGTCPVKVQTQGNGRGPNLKGLKIKTDFNIFDDDNNNLNIFGNIENMNINLYENDNELIIKNIKEEKNKLNLDDNEDNFNNKVLKLSHNSMEDLNEEDIINLEIYNSKKNNNHLIDKIEIENHNKLNNEEEISNLNLNSNSISIKNKFCNQKNRKHLNKNIKKEKYEYGNIINKTINFNPSYQENNQFNNYTQNYYYNSNKTENNFNSPNNLNNQSHSYSLPVNKILNFIINDFIN